MLQELIDGLQQCRFDSTDIQKLREIPEEGMEELADSLEELLASPDRDRVPPEEFNHMIENVIRGSGAMSA